VLVNGVRQYRNDQDTQRDAWLEKKLHFNNSFKFTGGWLAGVSALFESFAFDQSLYKDYAIQGDGPAGPQILPFTGTPHIRNADYVATLNTPQFSRFSGSIFYIWGRDENFFEWASANIVYSTLNAAWRPTERLRLDLSHNLQSFARRTDGSYVGIRRVPRVKVEYQATRHIFVRYVGEHATNYQDALRDDSRTGLPIVFVARDGTTTPASAVRTRSFRNDWLFSYQPRPGTVLFAGYGNTLANPGTDQLPQDLRRTRDGFFLKLSYLFRM
jgi:hypothetical protein